MSSRLRNLRATGRIRYLYKVASADVSVDVTTLNNFYWDPKVGGEWEQTGFFLNGVPLLSAGADATLQVKDAKRGAIHSHAGTGTYVSVSILEREA